jgi:hypothetical protein
MVYPAGVKSYVNLFEGLEECQIPPVKPAACFCEPLKAVDVGTA